MFISSIVVSLVISIVRSTVLPSGIGTVIDEDAILFFKKGSTFTITSDDLVILGIIFSPAALFSLKPSPATSANLFEFEYPCTVVKKALSTPTSLFKAFSIGATAFAVFDPSEKTSELKSVYSSFAPGT